MSITNFRAIARRLWQCINFNFGIFGPKMTKTGVFRLCAMTKWSRVMVDDLILYFKLLYIPLNTKSSRFGVKKVEILIFGCNGSLNHT